VIGLAGFLPQDDGPIELGYVVHARHWGGGYGTEAVRAALGALGDDPRVRLVIATIRPCNSRSLRVARAVGLRQIDSYVDDRGQMLVFGVRA
jgi:RimJ/RimL family protein N-acetyltransferase